MSEELLIARVFGSDVVALEADPSELGPRAHVYEEERMAVQRAVEKRRNEYFATRHLARQAFARLGVDSVPVLNAADRSPIWPAGVLGTLTHTAGWCGVALAKPSPTCLGLGVDAERCYDMSPEVAERVLTEREYAELAHLPKPRVQALATLMFSAKESVYKCIHPFVRRYVGFHEVEIELALRGVGGGFNVKFITQDLAPALPHGAALVGRLAQQGDLWLTGVTLQQST